MTLSQRIKVAVGLLGTLTLLPGARAARWTVLLSAADPDPTRTKSLAIIVWDERPGSLSER